MLSLVDVEFDFDLVDDGSVRGARARFMFNDRRYRKVDER